MRSAAWAWRSATSTAASSTACAPSAARCAPAATAGPTPACRAARRSKRRSPCSPASSRSAPTAPPSVDFDVPDFNGTVRVMAVAWSADKLGHAQKRRHRPRRGGAHRLGSALPDARRRGPPRHRRAQRRRAGRPPTSSSVDRRQATTAVADRHASTSRPASAAPSTSPIKPDDVGLRTYDVRVTGPDGIDVKRHLTFDVKPPAGDIKRTTVSVAQGQGRQAHAVEGSAARPDRQRAPRVNVSRRPGRDAWTCRAC